MNTLRAILLLDQTGAKLTDEYGNASGVSLELLFGSAMRLELDLRSATLNSDGQLSSYPASNFSGTSEYYFAMNDSFQSTSTPKYLQFENVGVQTVQGKTVFHAEISALNSESLSSALAGKESAVFFCECGGVNDANPPTVVFCFQFQLTIRNRIYPGAGSAVIAGVPAYYTALETEAAIGRTHSGGLALASGAMSKANAASSGLSTLSGTVSSMGGEISDLWDIVGDNECGNSALYTMASAGSATASVASAAVVNLSGSVEVLSGWVSSGGSMFHFMNSVRGDAKVSGGLVNDWRSDESRLEVFSGVVKHAEPYANEDDAGTVIQRGGVVSNAFVSSCDSGEDIRFGSYTISGGTLLAASVEGVLTVCRRGEVLSTCIADHGVVTVSSGATLSNITLNGGTLSCVSGGTAYGIHYISGTYISGGTTIFEED